MSPRNLKAETVRCMLQDVRKEAMKYGINVDVEAFDGQFSRLAMVSSDQNSLTILQLMRNHWKDTCSKSVTNLQSNLLDIGKVCSVQTFQDICKEINISVQLKDNNPTNGKVEFCSPIYVGGIAKSTKPMLNSVQINLVSEVLSEMDKENKSEKSKAQEQDESGIDQHIENGDSEEFQLDDYKTMLKYLHENSTVKRNDRWKQMSLETFIQIFNDANEVQNHFTKDELFGCLKVCTENVKRAQKLESISARSNKLALVNFFCKMSGGKSSLQNKPKLFQPKKLTTILRQKIKNIRKQYLNKIEAIQTWPNVIEDWRKNNHWLVSTERLKQEGFKTKHQWHCCSEIENGKQLFRFLDHHHLLTNCRLHCCRSGFPLMGINSSAWLRVAKDCRNNGTGLNLAYVEDLIDSQSNSVAQLTFSDNVEKVMCENGDENEANFCRLIRSWYEAVDEKGLLAVERVQRLLDLREYLLDKTLSQLQSFPPPGKHICDMPVVLFSGLLISCERLIQLYKICKSGTYNVRAIGSLDNETFFSSFRDLDPRGAGVLRPSEIPRAISVSCELLTTRLNPERGFYFNTTTKLPVYRTDTLEKAEEITEQPQRIDEQSNIDLFRNHPVFDAPRKTAPKRKRATISSMEECAHGSLGIRQYHRKDDEKVLPHKRACINMD